MGLEKCKIVVLLLNCEDLPIVHSRPKVRLYDRRTCSDLCNVTAP